MLLLIRSILTFASDENGGGEEGKIYSDSKSEIDVKWTQFFFSLVRTKEDSPHHSSHLRPN